MITRHDARRLTAALGLPLALTLVLAGCTGGSPESPEPTGSEATAQEPDGDAAEDAPEEEPGLPELATATGESPNGPVDVIVRSLEVDDNGVTMTLRVAFVPHFGEEGDTYNLSTINGSFFIHPVLLDREHLKRYSVITGEGTQDWLTNKDARTTPDEPLESWFVYAAPEDPIDSMTFTMDAWSVELADIPIGGDR